MAKVDADSVVRRHPDLPYRVVDDEVVMLDLDQGKYFGLDSVGSRIWELAEQPVSVGDLCTRLLEEFDVSAEQCLEDVLGFLEQMVEHELVEVVS